MRAPVPPPELPLTPPGVPAAFDGYRVLERLGRGGMGEVFLAHDTVLDRPVALKLVDPRALAVAGRERFLVEARAVARLQHPNVVAIYRVGEVGGRPYLVSEFVQGRSLDQLQVPLPHAQLLQIGLMLARGLAAAHRRGVLHRDIKPANAVLADSGEVKLLDFGLAKLLQDASPDATPLPAGPLPPAPPLPPAGGSLTETVLRPPAPPPAAAPGDTLDLPPRPGAWSTETVAHAPRAADEPFASDITSPGTLLGTPAYMAPEVWRGEGALYRSDVYSLGALLYQLAVGRPPFERKSSEALREAVLGEPPPPLAGVDERLARVVLRCLEKDPARRFPSGEELRAALEALVPDRAGEPLPEGNPYRGLHAFEAEHRALFFGRATEVRVLLERLRSEPFVLVAGTSGVGKSSLCRAGLLPRVADGGLGTDGRPWTCLTLTPGKRPLRALAVALAPWLGEDEDALAERLGADWAELARAVRRKAREGGGGLLLFVDQLEELVTLAGEDEARVAAQLLEALAAPGNGLRLLATCRGDFIARVGSLPGLAEEVARALYLLRPLSAEGVREAVQGPARMKGVSFESARMVDALCAPTLRGDGALPLLQFALAQLWEGRDAQRALVPEAALAAVGGVEGALARHADEVLAQQAPGPRAAARRVLVQLVTLEGTRARRSEEELGAGEDPSVAAALAALVRGRLLVASEGSEGAVYEVAHEALIRSWPTLQRWLEEDAERRALRERLAQAVAEWGRLGGRSDALWGPRQLAELRLVPPSELRERERVFVAASHRALRTRRRRYLGAALALAVLLAAASVWLQRRAGESLRARVAALTAEGERALAEGRARADEAERARAEAFAHFDARRAEPGEAAWERALARHAAADRRLARAAQALESALQLDADADAAHERLGDVLLARALLADAAGQGAARDELAARMSLYDPDGARARTLAAPATLSVTTEPAGAALSLRSARGGEPVALGEDARTLAPGSYVLEARAPGRPSVRLPLLLGRGEARAVRLALPERVPEGFVYVPAGRFLFGSAGDESLRRDFRRTVPQHPVETGAYLIARHETTYAEWLAYLDALPAAERARRLPRSDAGGFRGGMGLAKEHGRWVLTLQPAGKRFRVRWGERLHYPERQDAQGQDWRALPVSGVSLAQVEAYLAWLSASGRVPGARLCTELEWERAARGADGRAYPHGERLEARDANFDETYGNRPLALGPDAVGSHPASQSPFGVEDLVGNVWEWTRSSLPDAEVVARGGAFSYGRTSAWSTNREVVEPTLQDATLGLRVCADAPTR